MSDALRVPTVEAAGPAASVNANGRRLGRPWDLSLAVNTAVLYAVVIVAVIPVAFLVINSFDVAPFPLPYRFGFDNWGAVFLDRGNISAIATSFLLAFRTFAAGLVALVVSWCLVRLDLPGRRFIEVSLWFAFFMPAIPVAMAWVLLVNPDYGLINAAMSKVPLLSQLHLSVQSIAGIMWVHMTLTTIPFLTLLFTPIIRQFDSSFEDVARANGAGWFTVARRITMPLLAPAIIAGLIASYVRGFESFEVEQLLGTPSGIYVFSTRVYDLVSTERQAMPQAMALSTFLLAVAVALAALHNRFNRSRPTVVTSGSQGFRRNQSVSPVARRAISAAIIVAILVCIGLPIAVIVVCSFAKLFGFFNIPAPWTLAHWTQVLGDERFGRALPNSLLAGVSVGIVSVSLFFWLAWLLVRGRVAGKALAAQLFWLPWALPGFVAGLAMLWLTLRFDVLAPLYGTFIPILIVLALKELPIGVHLFKVAIEQLNPRLEEAAAVAGAGRFYAIRRITIPLLSSAIVSVFIIVFIAVVKDISSIVLLAAPGTETVSLLMYEYAFNGKAESAAVIGVLYSLAALALALLVSRRATAEHLR